MLLRGKEELLTAKKRNILVVGVVVALAAALLVLSALLPKNQSASGESEILITVDGKEWGRYPLSQPQTVVVEQADGCRNEIVITGEGAYMAASTCDNQLCVQMGEVTLDNWETRPNQAFIICLPNRVTVELIPVQLSQGGT